jgi:hypothetical protein
MHKPVIGIMGRAGAGKDTTADYLVEHRGFRKYGFSWALKDLVAREFDLERARMDELEYKETVVPGVVGPDGLPRTLREIFQLVGTDGFRAVDPNYWVKKAMVNVLRLIRDPAVVGVAIPDVRFINEAAAIRRAFPGGTIWRIVKEGGATTAAAAHSSEMEMDRISPSAVLQAVSGQKELLYTQAASLLGTLPVRPL